MSTSGCKPIPKRWWKTRNFLDIMALHHRPSGRQKGILGIHAYHGKLAYLVGYHPLFLIFKSIKRMASKPYVVGGAVELMSFFRCYLDGTQRSIDDREFIGFLRKIQVRRLLGCKS